MDCSPPVSSVHGDSPGKNTGVGCHFLLQGSSWPRDWTRVSHIAGRLITLCATTCSPPGVSVHGIFQAKLLEWFAISFSRGLSWPRDWSLVACTAGRFFTNWATRKAQRSYGWVLIQCDLCSYKKRRHTQRKHHVKTEGEEGHLQVKERGLRVKSTLLTPCSQPSNLQNCEKINVLSHPVSGVSVWQSSKLIHRGSSMVNPCAPITQLQQFSNIWPILFHWIACVFFFFFSCYFTSDNFSMSLNRSLFKRT